MMPRDCDGEEEEEEDKGTLVSWDVILSDGLLQKVLSFLSIANIIRLGIVCKRWYEVVHSRHPLSWPMMAPHTLLFFRPCFNGCSFSGHVYDPYLLQWYNFDSPRLEKIMRLTSSSCGLVCLMNPNDGSRLLVGNPIKRDWKLLPQVPGNCNPYSNAIALSFDNRTRGYTVVVAKCLRTRTQLPGQSLQWHLSVHIYQSANKLWATPFAQDLGQWKGSHQAVICDGVLYYLVAFNLARLPHLVAFDLAKPPSTIESLIQESIPAPYPLACAGLINLSNKLVMVGRVDRLHKGVVILELEDKAWREVAQMPFSVYMTLDSKNFTCCGAGDFLFMHFSVCPALLIFDMSLKVWQWSSHCPCPCAYTGQWQSRSLSNCGICFEPRLDVSP